VRAPAAGPLAMSGWVSLYLVCKRVILDPALSPQLVAFRQNAPPGRAHGA
jgi:hypothetical protein